jgi:hypothetical protein
MPKFKVRDNKHPADKTVEFYLERAPCGSIEVVAQPEGGQRCYILAISSSGVRRIGNVSKDIGIELDSNARIKEYC